ncbi:MAG: AAA family ATPase [Candidatus Njordarchaeia archaeon]
MVKKKTCLEEGIFSISTIKTLENVFDREKEKRVLKNLIESRAWITVSGLRRTGKTTLVRSISNTLSKFHTIYINAWTFPNVSPLNSFLEALKDELAVMLERNKIKRLLGTVKKLGFLGVSLEFREKSQLKLLNVLKETSTSNPIILIIDEAPHLFNDRNVERFLTALHDLTAPNLIVVLTGSTISMKKLIEESEESPLYGRIEEEIKLDPFDEINSRNFLVAGFKQCGVEPDEEILDMGTRRLGGFAGWLTLFGRIVVRKRLLGEEYNLEVIVSDLENEAFKLIYSEVARFLQGKKNIREYLKIIKLAAEEGDITISRIAKAIKRDPSTSVFYVEQLTTHGLLKKMDKYYIIPDPMIRRAALNPNFEKEIKIRL